MNIITNRHKNPGDVIPPTESESNVREEANKRTYKAGYTDRDGQPKIRKIQDRGYGESRLSVWPRDENGNLIGD